MNALNSKEYIEHEVKLGIHEFKMSNVYREIQQLHQETKRIDQKIDTKFNWFYGLMVAAIFVPKLISWLHIN